MFLGMPIGAWLLIGAVAIAIIYGFYQLHAQRQQNEREVDRSNGGKGWTLKEARVSGTLLLEMIDLRRPTQRELKEDIARRKLKLQQEILDLHDKILVLEGQQVETDDRHLRAELARQKEIAMGSITTAERMLIFLPLVSAPSVS